MGAAGADPQALQPPDTRNAGGLRDVGVSLEWLEYGDDNFMEYYHERYQAMEMDFRNLVRRGPRPDVVTPLDDYHQPIGIPLKWR